MSDDDTDEQWADANRIGDRIVDILNEERLKPEFSVQQLLAGQMLALLGFMGTAPKHLKPFAFIEAESAIAMCLRDMMEARARDDS